MDSPHPFSTTGRMLAGLTFFPKRDLNQSALTYRATEELFAPVIQRTTNPWSNRFSHRFLVVRWPLVSGFPLALPFFSEWRSITNGCSTELPFSVSVTIFSSSVIQLDLLQHLRAILKTCREGSSDSYPLQQGMMSRHSLHSFVGKHHQLSRKLSLRSIALSLWLSVTRITWEPL